MDSILSKILKKDLFYDYAHPSSLILDTHLMPWRILAKVLGQQPRRFPFFVITRRQEARARVAWERGKAGRWKENFMVLSSLSIAIARKTHPFSLPPPRLTWPFSAWTCSKTQGWANNSGNGLIRASYLTIASSIKWINRFRLEGNRILWSHNSP